ncbi:MAG TPA: sulfotransferase family 2 domain-containing protein [Patescibacteria group bacterium]|nr:sulfotransferase family 2 domain-containing protein [Patescibacteria group bacterium]
MMPILKTIYPNPDSYLFVRVPRTGSTSICNALHKPTEHRTAQEWLGMLPDFASRYKFTIVRHPYDRFLSLFYFFGVFLTSNKDPNDFLTGGDLQKAITAEPLITRPQHEYICDQSGRVLVDYVGRYETLQESWKVISGRLNVDEVLPLMRSCLYEKVPLNDASKAVIYEVYRKDFELFNYQP